MNTCIVGIGSNIEADVYIPKAIEMIGRDCKILQISGMMKTKPIGYTQQDDFTNGAVKIATNLNRRELNSYLKKIEDQLGRDRTQIKFGPRTIDLDLMIWNGQVVDKDYYTRDFLRQSAAELGFTASE